LVQELYNSISIFGISNVQNFKYPHFNYKNEVFKNFQKQPKQ